jgi:hypothetical protein
MLNPGKYIMLVGQYGDTRILVGFHPQPGNYKAFLPPDIELEPESLWDFFCPVCQESLVTEVSDDLCALDMLTANKPHRVYFSRRAGVQATFVISAEGFLERFGAHVSQHPLDILELI